MIIYEAINIVNGKRYIGQSIYSLQYRKTQHEKSIKYNHRGCKLFKRALIKYGINNFEWKVIDTASSHEDLDIKESFWISFFNTTNTSYGYNLKGGGYEPFLTDVVKRSIGESQKGSLNHMYGKYDDKNPNSKRVLIVSTKEIFNSVSELCRNHPTYNVSKVCSVCRGDRYTYKGEIFRYIDSNGNIVDNGVPADRELIANIKHKNLSKSSVNGRRILDITNNILYSSVTEAVTSRYRGSLLRKLKGSNECDYHNIHWKLL